MSNWPLFFALACTFIIGFALGVLLLWWAYAEEINDSFLADWNDWDGSRRGE